MPPGRGPLGGPLFGGRARYRRPGPFAKSRGRRCGRWRRVTPRRSSAAEAPAVAPDAPPAWAEIAATPAPGSAMPSRSASAGDRGHIGWRHRLCAHRAKRLGIVRCERARSSAPGRLLQTERSSSCVVTSHFLLAARRAEKRFPPRNAIDRAAGRRVLAAFGIAPTRAAWGMAVLGVSNFAQTVAARPGSFPHPAG